MPSRKQYGSKGQTWHPDCVAYMEFIARHPHYSGMPDAAENKIQWKGPRSRLWQIQGYAPQTPRLVAAQSSRPGISTSAEEWISKTAKRLHPTGKKPCKRCGRVLEIRYAYPREALLNRVRKLEYVKADFELDRLEHVAEFVSRLHAHYGKRFLDDLPTLLRASGIIVPASFDTLAACLKWIDSHYIPAEPSVLSARAMSNAPDRFDGFHSFNLCCRSKADTGRHKENLAGYVTDRRVFEYWADGDWIAADRLMGEIRARLRNEPCRERAQRPVRCRLYRADLAWIFAPPGVPDALQFVQQREE